MNGASWTTFGSLNGLWPELCQNIVFSVTDSTWLAQWQLDIVRVVVSFICRLKKKMGHHRFKMLQLLSLIERFFIQVSVIHDNVLLQTC